MSHHVSNVQPVRRRIDSEHAETIQSDISMSIVTDDTRHFWTRQSDSTYRAMNKNRSCLFSINVEPVLIMISICFGFYATNASLFTYWARCIQIANKHEDLVHNATYTCSRLSSLNGTLQDDVETDIATARIYMQVIGCVPTLIIGPLLGTWSDRNGRKPPLMFTLFGLFIASLLYFLATITYETISVYYWFFTAEFLMGMFGGGATASATCLAIITDDVRHKLKPGSSTVPIRIGVASFAQSIGMMMGTFIVSMISVPALTSIDGHIESYIKSSFIQAALPLMALLYTIFLVRETHFPTEAGGFGYNRIEDMEDIDQQSTSFIDEAPKSLYSKLTSYLSSVFGVLTVRRPGWTRLCLCVSLIFVFIEFLSFDPSLLLLLVKRLPFDWNDSMFGYFTLTRGIVTSIGMVLCPLMLTLVHWLGKDSLLIILALFSSAMASYITAFATNTNHIFYTAGLSLFTGAMQPAYRSFLPRMVAKDETARLLTCAALIISFAPIISSLILNTIFEATITWWPGFVFFVSGTFQTIVFFGQIGVHLLMRPQWKLDKELRRRQTAEVDANDAFEERQQEPTEQRSISNTAVESDGGSRRDII